MLSPAVSELESLLRAHKSERQMVSYHSLWDCDIPAYALEIYAYKLHSRAMAKASITEELDGVGHYLQLMVRNPSPRPQLPDAHGSDV